jgi:hypothetical protein
MTVPIEDSFSSKLMHFGVIILIVAYVVFVKKPYSVVESVRQPAKTVHAPYLNIRSDQKG